VFQVSVVSSQSHALAWMLPPLSLLAALADVACRRSVALAIGTAGPSTRTRKYASMTGLWSTMSVALVRRFALLASFALMYVSASTTPTGQTGTPEPVHTPALQVSTPVQALPSSQLAPFCFSDCTHPPVAGTQLATWQESDGVQTTGLPPTHVPP
jgi:hypothetical protein